VTEPSKGNGARISTGAKYFEMSIKQNGNWSESDIVMYTNAHPQRHYFSHLFAFGGFLEEMKIGVQDGRFSEIFMEQNSELMNDRWTWVLVDRTKPYKVLE
jgi:hypothetical protein